MALYVAPWNSDCFLSPPFDERLNAATLSFPPRRPGVHTGRETDLKTRKPMTIPTRTASTRPVLALIAVGLFFGAGRIEAQEVTQWPLSDAVNVFFHKFGGIASVDVAEGRLLGQSQLSAVLDPAGVDRIALFQTWGSVAGDAVEIDEERDSVTVKGALGGEKTPEVPRWIEFSESYKKIADGTARLHVDAEYLADATANEPVSYWLRFPAADYDGGQCDLVDKDGAESSLAITGETLAELSGFLATKAVFSKGGWAVTVESDPDTVLSVLDSRAWGGDGIIIKIWEKQPWNPPFSYAKGTKQSFGAKISFKKMK